MKQLIFILNVMITFLSLSSCDGERDLTNYADPLQPYIAFGNIHNAMLEKTQEAIEENITRSEGFNAADWTELHELQKEQVQYMDISDRHKIILKNALDTHFDYYNINQIWEKAYSTTSDNTVSEMELLIIQLHSLSLIDNFERILLTKLNEYIIKQKSEPQFAILFAIQGLANEWRKHYGNTSLLKDQPKQGIFSAYILGICISSAQWWEENPENAAPSTRVAPWVYIDALGALRAGCYAAIQQQVTSNLSGKVDWEGIVYSALAGAVVSSTTGLKQVAAIIISIIAG